MYYSCRSIGNDKEKKQDCQTIGEYTSCLGKTIISLNTRRAFAIIILAKYKGYMGLPLCLLILF